MERKSYPITLPSKGKFYGGKLPDGKIEIHPMRVFEEKMLASMVGTGPQKMSALIKSCLKTEFDPDEMLSTDRMYILLQLHMISYGTEKEINLTCSNCSSRFDFTIDFENDIEVKEVEDTTAEPFKIILPVSEEEVELRFLRGNDETKMTKALERYRRRKKVAGDSDPLIVLSLILPIISINGEERTQEEKEEWAEGLIGKDASFLRKAFTQFDFGIETELTVECPSCQSVMEVPLPVEEFFRD